MLPFPKRKATGDEVELTDDDLVLVEEQAPPAPRATSSSHSHVRASSPARPAGPAGPAGPRAQADRAHRSLHGSALPPGSRRVLDEQVEEDVADQCLASIAAATSLDSPRPRRAHQGSESFASSSHLRAALGIAPLASPPVHAPAHVPAPTSESAGRLPSVSAPPFVRTAQPWSSASSLATVGSASMRAAEAPGIRDSSPPSAFIRRSSPALAYPVSSTTLPPAAPSSVGVGAGVRGVAAYSAESSFGSVAPVSMPSLPSSSSTAQEPTVIVVRERPRSIWILAAAALGACAAIAAMRFAPAAVSRSDSREASSANAAQAVTGPVAVLPLPPSAIVLPVATDGVAPPGAAAVASPAASVASPAVAPRTAAPSGASSTAVMHFTDEQGVAFKAPASAPAPAPRKPSVVATVATQAAPVTQATRPQPRVSSMGPALPDGSFGLGRADSPAAVAPAPPAPPAAPPAPAPEPPRKRVLTPEQQLAEAQLKASMR